MSLNSNFVYVAYAQDSHTTRYHRPHKSNRCDYFVERTRLSSHSGRLNIITWSNRTKIENFHSVHIINNDGRKCDKRANSINAERLKTAARYYVAEGPHVNEWICSQTYTQIYHRWYYNLMCIRARGRKRLQPLCRRHWCYRCINNA